MMKDKSREKILFGKNSVMNGKSEGTTIENLYREGHKTISGLSGEGWRATNDMLIVPVNGPKKYRLKVAPRNLSIKAYRAKWRSL